MITDADIKKMKHIFATKDDLRLFTKKKDLKSFATNSEFAALDLKMERGFSEIINFIGEVKNEIMKELNDFRLEVREMNKNSGLILNNHEARIARLEFSCK